MRHRRRRPATMLLLLLRACCSRRHLLRCWGYGDRQRWESESPCVMITLFIPVKLALECETGKDDVNGRCCSPCSAGEKVYEPCSATKNTTCLPCDPRTYTAQENVLKKCHQCKVCDHALGFVTRKECLPISNTVCNCATGYVCAAMKDDDCQKCVPNLVCNPGEYLKLGERNTCEECPAGTFSPNGTLQNCVLWTNCIAQGLSEEKPGTNTTDALCSLPTNTEQKPIIIIGIIGIIGIIIGICSICCPGHSSLSPCRRQNQERTNNEARLDEAPHPVELSDCPEANGSIYFSLEEIREQEESAPSRERMFMIQDSTEPWEYNETPGPSKEGNSCDLPFEHCPFLQSPGIIVPDDHILRNHLVLPES
ncbi:tumor necrosis factor receptor superfamily member 14-like isoform X2 [Dromiciops gliroides]|uniref:tumor necrosis factor receptor superfamily member 14-like isoform X2 n=1 Tax=Dromiciops gliroides TaxID=33562 RepID=UPI001CC7481E|nr:tumor necrosis factor receptor superfamily member 14-like isoform X2 [Dromiciops gliroides]